MGIRTQYRRSLIRTLGILITAGLALACTDSPVQPAPKAYSVGGTVFSLAGAGLVLVNNGGDKLPVSTDGPITFATPLAAGADYSVTVLTQPTSPAQTCVVNGGSGTITGTDVTTVTVTCFLTGSASPFLVSSPVPDPSPSAPGTRTARVSAAVVYVSLAPGAIPNGVSATIQDLHTGSSVTAAVVNGGFDPVALSAVVGDTLAIAVRTTGAGGPSYLSVVAGAKGPTVVRTDPPPHKRDVPLNGLMVIVFSEPIDPVTLTSSTVQLKHGTTPITGQLAFADPAHLRASFTPNALLTGATDYELTISQGITAVNGQPLDSAIAVPFTTGTTPPATNLIFASVSSGYYHSCGVTTAGAAYCWGDNDVGQLGDDATASSVTPVPVAGEFTFTAVSAGWQKTCGVTTSSAVYCWGIGVSRAGVSGGASSIPVSVSGGLKFAAVSAGGTHSCGVTTAGAAYCWGDGQLGQRGDGDTSMVNLETPVPVLGGLTFAEVSAGWQHTCGVTPTGVAYCWGVDLTGDLGIGTSTGPEQCQWGVPYPCSKSPVAVAGGLNFAAVSTGADLTCGVTTSNAPYCWGNNSYGVLGNDPNTGPGWCESEPDSNDGTTYSFPCSSVPVAVAGGLSLASLTAGAASYSYACGLTPTGTTYCWGRGPSGNGNNGTISPVKVADGLTFATLSAGSSSICGVTTAGVAYCWGANDHGQLGDGTTISSNAPVKVAGQP